jgi:hypothetical protein
MKSNELRIGNYLNLSDKYKVWQIEDGHDIDKCKYNPFIEPILLTKEWLRSLGFEEIKGRVDIFEIDRLRVWTGARGQSLVYLIEENTTSAHYIPNGIQYVHQIQNLYFSLYGKELILKQKI